MSSYPFPDVVCGKAGACDAYIRANINNPNNPKSDYILLITKIRTKPTKRIHEGDVKKAGKMVHFKRFVFVPPYDFFEIIMTDGRKIWNRNNDM